MRTYCFIFRQKHCTCRYRLGHDNSIEWIAGPRLPNRPRHNSRKWSGVLLKPDGFVEVCENLTGRHAEPANFP